MKNKKLIQLLAVVCIVAIPAYNLCKTLISNNYYITKANVDLSEVEEIEKADTEEVLESIREVNPDNAYDDSDRDSIQTNTGSGSQFSSDEISEKVKSGELSYSKIFRDTLIVGDSLVEALDAYDVIDSENVIGKVSASLYHLQSVSDQIISYHPKVLILHYGENHLGGPSQEYVDNFITFYTSLVKNFKENLPGTRIVISSIFPANEQGLVYSPELKYVPSFNDGLEKMCNDLDVEYLDNSPMFSGDTSFYEPDGVHMKRVFYSDYWLPFMASELNLI